jgi:hypothetical protein
MPFTLRAQLALTIVRPYNRRPQQDRPQKDRPHKEQEMKTDIHAARQNQASFIPGFRNIKVLPLEKLCGLGNSTTLYSVLVEVELAKPFP